MIKLFQKTISQLQGIQVNYQTSLLSDQLFKYLFKFHFLDKEQHLSHFHARSNQKQYFIFFNHLAKTYLGQHNFNKIKKFIIRFGYQDPFQCS